MNTQVEEAASRYSKAVAAFQRLRDEENELYKAKTEFEEKGSLVRAELKTQ